MKTIVNTLSNHQKNLLKNAAYGISDQLPVLEDLESNLRISGNKGAASKVSKLIKELKAVMDGEVLHEAYQKL